MNLAHSLDVGRWVAWIAVFAWAFDLVPGWVPQVIGIVGLAGWLVLQRRRRRMSGRA